MRSIVIEQAGGAEVLQVKEMPDLTPRYGEMIIDVAYAGVGLVDILARNGAFAELFPFPIIPGLEVSGYVRSIGDGVHGYRVGQPVAAMKLLELGGYATQARVTPELTVPLDELDGQVEMSDAAASIVNLTTAYMAVKYVNRMREGDTILVHAAAGGLGSFLGQIAKRFGASKVLGTVGSSDKIKLAASLGYDELLLRSDFVAITKQLVHGRGVDAIFDPVGGETRARSMELLKPLGQMIALGNASGGELMHATNEIWLGNQNIAGFNLGAYAVYDPQLVGQAARDAMQLLANGKIRSEVYGVYPMERASEAHRLLESRQATGKLVLQMA
ncbi:NADPH:quinone reductase-like Zn-dependent oxidoreductase [Paenibacillus phyllosphaerae]|uniref:NADPH:quinone reductase-like Zn-dependent oxidoreductase n=1 Tax=Paenibacillus phyllosphaerae TaxID=274593 RepID=A0A7W5AX11_9BACL|nr:zinc-binding dehydrogenase [Paenibacillus phyllosphaerae]MBB3110147.1 NADPH:quinone reductase-like Zn-dependent oxidoreductase [Paenibacillus phyllosphaerae]